MCRGRKMKVPEIDAIVSVTCSGAAHELERASYDLVAESYALDECSPARAEEHKGATVSAGRRACASGRRTSGATC